MPPRFLPGLRAAGFFGPLADSAAPTNPMKPADYPFPIRVLLVATLVLFVVNVFFFSGPLSAFFAWANSITPGLATLIGSLIGLSVIGWQARQGFNPHSPDDAPC
jgi:hypothetical protein